MRISRRIMTASLLLGPFAAGAQTRYPDRPVRVIVPFGPGGLADVTMRIIGDKLGQQFGQQILVVNQPGGAGAIAARNVISSAADGYTLALLTNGTAVSAAAIRSLGFNPMADFVPVSSLGFFEFVVATSKEHSYHSFADLLKAARDNPGKLNIGTILPGSTQHLSAVLLRTLARAEMTIVPFRTTGDAITALLRKDVDVIIDGFSATGAMISDGQIRALATTGAQRSSVLPDVPTVIEAGIADFDVTSWNALFAPVGTPPAIIDALNAGLRTAITDANVTRRLIELGITARASSPEEIGARLGADIIRWTEVVNRTGIERL